MKKIIFLVAIALLSITATAGTPIATKNIGIDSVSGLQMQVQAWQITIDTKSDVILVVYDIVLLSPNGSVVSVIETTNYTRVNLPNDPRFNMLRASPLGQSIEAMVNETIQLYPDVNQ